MDSIRRNSVLKQEDDYRRYFLVHQSDGSWAIADRNIPQTERDYRIIVGLPEIQAQELVNKLNAKLK